MPAPPHRGAAPYGAPPYPVDTAHLVVKERPFALGLFLVVVTLGLYRLYWHWVVHDETCRQRGVENRAKPLWIGYVSLWALAAALGFLFPEWFQSLLDVGFRDLPAWLARFMLLLTLIIVVSIVSEILFVLYALRQWEGVREAKARMGLQMRAGVSTFFWLYYGSLAGMLFAGWLFFPLIGPLVLIPLAYYYLQENHNDIARAIRHGQVDPAAYAPGGPGWREGPYGPARGGPAPVLGPYPYGTPAPAAAPAHPHAAAPAASYGMPSTSWDAPTSWSAHAPPAPAHAAGAPTPHDARTAGTAPPPLRPPASRAGPTPTGFSIRDRGGAASAGSVEQHFQCPRCHAHVRAVGPPGAPVAVRCPHCGESGTVTLPG